MPDFDILGPSAYGSQPAQGSPGGGFDILGTAYDRPQIGPNGQPLTNGAPGAPGGQPQAQQPQGAPMSGLLAGILGLPQYGGAIPGAAYATPQQQAQPNAGQHWQQMSPLMAGIIGGGR